MNLIKVLLEKRVKFVIGDVRDTETLKDNMSYCTYAIHAAAMKDLIFCEDQVWQSCLNNISGSQSFLEAVKFSKKLKKKSVVYQQIKLLHPPLYMVAQNILWNNFLLRHQNILMQLFQLSGLVI